MQPNMNEVMLDPFTRSLALAPQEEHEISQDTASVIERSRLSLGSGAGISHDDVLREFGMVE